MEPVFAGASQRGTAGDRRGRELRLARRATGPGRRLRARLRRIGNRQVGGLADRRRTPGGAARRGGRRAPKAAVPPRRLLSGTGRRVLGETHPVEPLGRVQSPPRTLAGPPDLLPHQAGAVGRRSPGDERGSLERTAAPLQRRLRRQVAVDRGAGRRRPAPGTAAASRPGAAGQPDPHAADHRSRFARGTLRTA